MLLITDSLLCQASITDWKTLETLHSIPDQEFFGQCPYSRRISFSQNVFGLSFAFKEKKNLKRSKPNTI